MKPTDVDSGLTIEFLKSELHYSPETGHFKWLDGSQKKTGHLLYINKTKENPYLIIGLIGRNFLCHRLAWFYMTGAWPKEMLDHINGNKSDNRFSNLREATRSQNCGNHHNLRRSNTSGFRGVSPRENGKWRASIRIDEKLKCLGTFSTKEDAKAAYDVAFRAKYGEYANVSI